MSRPALSMMLGRFLIVLLLAAGCRSTQSYIEEVYENEPMIAIEYNAAGEPTFFRTRTINLGVENCDGGRCILNLQAVLGAVDRATDSSVVRDGILRFRSLSPQERFRDNRTLSLAAGGRRWGPFTCVYEGSTDVGNRVREDLDLFTTFEMIAVLADADTVRGTLGGVAFTLPAARLAPLRALIDTATASRHNP